MTTTQAITTGSRWDWVARPERGTVRVHSLYQSFAGHDMVRVGYEKPTNQVFPDKHEFWSVTPEEFLAVFKPAAHPRRPDGFTLIELLVVVAIVSVLVSVLMTSLAGSRNAARNVKCMSNLKQAHLALAAYADLHKALPMWCGPGSDVEIPRELYDCPLDRPPAEAMPGSYGYLGGTIGALDATPTTVVFCEYRPNHPEYYRVRWDAAVIVNLSTPMDFPAAP